MRPRIASPPLPTSEPRTSCPAPAAKSAVTPVACLEGGGWGVEKERKRSLPEIQLTAGHVFSEKWAGRGETSAAKNKQSAYLERLRRCKDASGRFGPTDLPLGLAACLICGVSHGPSTFGQSSVAPFLFSLPHRLPAGLGPPPPAAPLLRLFLEGG